MIGPMSVLVACCFLIGLAPKWIAPVIGQGVSAWAPEIGGTQSATDHVGTTGDDQRHGSRVDRLAGFVRPVAEESTAESCRGDRSHMGLRLRCADVPDAVHVVLIRGDAGRSCSPARCVLEHIAPGSWGLFPQPAEFHSDVPDTVLASMLPTFRFVAWLLSWCRIFQQGNIHFYLLYIFLALLVLLLWR